MDGFGPVTNTRSLEGSVIGALEQLGGLQESAQLITLRERGVRYRDILASWELMPPQPTEQAETVSHVLQLLGEIMAFVSGTEPYTLPPRSSEPPAPSTPARPTPAAPMSAPPTSKSSAFASKRPPSGGRQRHMPSRDRMTNKRQVSVGRIELEQVYAGNHSKADILFPFRYAWSKLAALPGGAARRLHDDRVTGEQHVIVRLVEGAELGEHRQDGIELIYILGGGLRIGDESIFAGAVVCTHAGSVCPAMTSLGETELLIIGSYRAELKDSSAVSSAR